MGDILYFPDKIPEDKKQKFLKNITMAKIRNILDATEEKYVYPDGSFKANDEIYYLYLDMMITLLALEEEEKIECEFDDPRIPYDVHEVTISWKLKEKEELPINANDIKAIIEPIAKANGDKTINIEPNGRWVFYVEIYSES